MKKIIMDIFDFFEILYKYIQASIILGEDFICPENITLLSKDVIFTKEYLKQLGKTIPKRRILKQCRDGNFFLVPGPNRPMSFLELCETRKTECSIVEYQHKWCSKQDFAYKDKVGTGWYIIGKDIVNDSVSKRWHYQQLLLAKNEIVPNVTEFTWAIVIYKMINKIQLFREIGVRTSSLDSGGNHLIISLRWTDYHDLYFDNYRSADVDDHKSNALGLSVAMKPDLKS
jgi:hypothetical protein